MGRSPAQSAAYQRDGFVALINLLASCEARTLRERFEETERRYPARLNASPQYQQ